MTLWTVARQAPLSMAFSWQEYWGGLPFPPPGDLPDPGTRLLGLLHWQADSFPLSHQGNPCINSNDTYQSSFHRLSTGLSSFQMSTSLILTVTLWGQCRRCHFTDEEMEAEELGSLSKVTRLVDDRAGIQIQGSWPGVITHCHLLMILT